MLLIRFVYTNLIIFLCLRKKILLQFLFYFKIYLKINVYKD